MKNKKPKWDGRSRVSTNAYRKRFNEIKWSNMDEIAMALQKHKKENLKKE